MKKTNKTTRTSQKWIRMSAILVFAFIAALGSNASLLNSDVKENKKIEVDIKVLDEITNEPLNGAIITFKCLTDTAQKDFSYRPAPEAFLYMTSEDKLRKYLVTIEAKKGESYGVKTLYNYEPDSLLMDLSDLNPGDKWSRTVILKRKKIRLRPIE